MSYDQIIPLLWNFSLAGAVLAFALFTSLAIKARSIHSLQFQLSAFMLFWVVGEIPFILEALKIADVHSYYLLGGILHTISMAAFAVFIMYRWWHLTRG